MSLQGNLSDLPLIDLVQILTLQDKTGILSINREFSQAQICFTKARICAAHVHQRNRNQPLLHLQGEEALYDLLSWTEGQFNLELTSSLPISNVNLSWNYIILEYCRRQDEQERVERMHKLAMVCPRLLPNPSAQAQITLELEDWQVLLQVNGQLTLHMIASNIRQELGRVLGIAEKLEKQGLLELSSNRPASEQSGFGTMSPAPRWQPEKALAPTANPGWSGTANPAAANPGWSRTTKPYPNTQLPTPVAAGRVVVEENKVVRPQVQRGLLSGIMAKIRGL